MFMCFCLCFRLERQLLHPGIVVVFGAASACFRMLSHSEAKPLSSANCPPFSAPSSTTNHSVLDNSSAGISSSSNWLPSVFLLRFYSADTFPYCSLGKFSYSALVSTKMLAESPLLVSAPWTRESLVNSLESWGSLHIMANSTPTKHLFAYCVLFTYTRRTDGNSSSSQAAHSLAAGCRVFSVSRSFFVPLSCRIRVSRIAVALPVVSAVCWAGRFLTVFFFD